MLIFKIKQLGIVTNAVITKRTGLAKQTLTLTMSKEEYLNILTKHNGVLDYSAVVPPYDSVVDDALNHKWKTVCGRVFLAAPGGISIVSDIDVRLH